MNNFFAELKRRNVFRVGIAYGVVGWLLVQVTANAVPAFSMPPWVNTVVFYFILISFPIALLFAWAYELTPEGLKKTKEVDKKKSIRLETGKKINKIIATGFVLAIGFIVYDKFISPPEPVVIEAEAAGTSIAVLPFVNMSDDAANEYFSDGISEELLNVLARVPNLKVAGRTSSFQFKGENPDLRNIGEILGVRHILEGSVRKSGTRVRITAQLVDAETGFHLWSETYDRELTDIFAIQDEIAENIATALLGTLGAEGLPKTRTGGTENVEAYNLYLQANFVRAERTEENLTKAEALLKRAVDIDANFADGWGALAKSYYLMLAYGYISTEVATREFNNAVEKALALDPENSEALASLGGWKVNVDLDFLGAMALFEQAIKSNPNNIEAHHWHSLLLFNLGRIKEGLQGLKANYERDPFYQVTTGTYLERLLSMGEFEEVKKVLATVDKGQLGRSFEGVRAYHLFAIALMEGNIPEAEKQLAKLDEILGERAIRHHKLIIESEEDKKLATTQMLSLYQAGKVTDMQMVDFFSFFGDYETALPYARRVVDKQRTFFYALMLGAHPDLDPRVGKVNSDLTPLLPYIPEYVEAYERAGIDIYEMLQIERPADE